MRLMLAALVATAAIAVTASVFAIWAGVSDAPWEQDVSVVEYRTEELPCTGALRSRRSIIAGGPRSPFNPYGVPDYITQLDKADLEIVKYC